MLSQKTVRSALAILAICGLAACGKNNAAKPAANNQPSAPKDTQELGAATDFQKSTVKIQSTTDEAGASIPTDASPALVKLGTVDHTLITKQPVAATDGSAMGYSMIIDLLDSSNASIARFHGNADFSNLVLDTKEFPATGATAILDANGMITSLKIMLNEGRAMVVILELGPNTLGDTTQPAPVPAPGTPEQGQKQETPKQEQKQETPKQEQKAPAKVEAPKQEQKQETPKQEQKAPAKVEAPKQEQKAPAKVEAPKQEQKQETPKQEQKAPAKVEAPKQEQKAPAKVEAPKQEQKAPAKVEAPKQEQKAPAKVEAPKQEQKAPAKVEAPKQEQKAPAKVEAPKQEQKAPAKVEAPKQEQKAPAKVEAPKQEQKAPAKVEAPKQEQKAPAKVEAPKQEQKLPQVPAQK